MRLLRFLGRWYLIATVASWAILGPDPRSTALLLLGVVVVNNWRRRRDRAAFFGQPRMVAAPSHPAYVPAYHPPTPSPASPPPASPGGGWRPPARMACGALVAILALGAIGLHSSPAVAASRSRAVGIPASFGPPDPGQWLLDQLFVNPFKAQAHRDLKITMAAAEASFLTPAVNNEPRVQELWRLLLVIADSLLLMLLVVGALMVVAGDWTYLEAKALAPRVLIAGMAMNLSLVVMGQAIDMSNQVVKAFLDFGGSQSLSAAGDKLAAQITAPLTLTLLLIAVLFLLICDLLRLVIVVVLAVGGPLLQAFGVLPATDRIARGWWRALAACLIAPMVQALLLVIGVWMAFSTKGPIADAFAGHPWSHLIDGAMLLSIIVLMALSPLWMLKKALGGSSRHVVRAIKAGTRMMGVGA